MEPHTKEARTGHLFQTMAEPRMELIHLRLDEIEVRHNPRRLANVAAIKRLAVSIARVGLEQPLLVSREGGGCVLVAGGRRLQAVKELGWEEVPCVVMRDDEPYLRRARAGAENGARVGLEPTEEAGELAALMDELGLALEEAAEAVGISVQTARERRLPLLELPRPVRARIHAGEVGIDSAMRLVRIARRAPRIATEVAERLASGALEPRAFESDPAGALAAIAAEESEAEALCLPFSEGTRLEVGETARRLWAACERDTLDEDVAKKLRGARSRPPGTLLEVTVTDLTAAQGTGALLSYRRGPSTVDFLVDPAWGAHWLVDALSRALALAEEMPEREAIEDGADAEAERVRRKAEAAAAAADNEILGEKVMVSLDHLREVPKPVAELIAGHLLDAHGQQMALGARLVRRKWWRREVKEMRSGAIRSTERPLEADEARERIEEHILAGETGAEVIGRLAAHLVSAVGCDQRVLAPSARRRIVLPYGGEGTVAGQMGRALVELAGRVLPKRRYEVLRAELGLEDAAPLRDRRSRRQIEREERERAAKEAAEAAREEATRPWESLLEAAPEVSVATDSKGGTVVEAAKEAGE